tara:strand:+ start:158 stop:526 length:369 start_codon:yes stop_codon:yes gene_type:complete
VENNQTGKQSSLKTRDRSEAEQLLNARNQDSSQTQLNREIGLTYIKGSDPELANRTWQKVFDAVCSVGLETTQSRRGRLYGKSCFDVIRDKRLLKRFRHEIELVSMPSLSGYQAVNRMFQGA